jgi:hypothetical protein
VAAENPIIVNALYDLCLPHFQKFLSVAIDDEFNDEDDDNNSYSSIMNMLDDDDL